MDFGRGKLKQALVNRIDKQFKSRNLDENEVEKSLVVGVFGEWGSGKSFLLNALKNHYAEALVQAKTDSRQTRLIVPIPFNPWRFEAEEHLIVPLLLTIKVELERRCGEEASAWRDVIRKAGTKLEDLANAFAYSLKLKLGVPKLAQAEFDLAKGVEQQTRMRERQAEQTEREAHHFTDDLNSLYYNFQYYLEHDVLKKDDKDRQINLLFLIDDIDRCLPERAVQMLEAIKLFLEVEGCAFVLALDDEVVERGVRHRYRDYLWQQPQNGSNNNDTSEHHYHVPITGTEYLEKMVHLPLRLPLPNEQQIRAFLTQRFKSIFIVPDETASHHQDSAQELLDLFVKTIPPIPRKLIRACELFQLLLDITCEGDEQKQQRLNKPFLARLVILSLFSPELYRLGRRETRIFGVMVTWQAETKGYWLNDQFILEKRLELKSKIEQYKEKEDFGSIRVIESVDIPLLQCLQNACRNRSGFDPRVLMKALSSVEVEQIDNYLSLIDDTSASSAGDVQKYRRAKPSKQPAEGIDYAKIKDIIAFVEDLLAEREEAWQEAFKSEALKDKVLDSKTFDYLRKQLEQNMRVGEILKNNHWLALLSLHLVTGQVEHLHPELLKTKQEELDNYISFFANDGDSKKAEAILVQLAHYCEIYWPSHLETALQPYEERLVQRFLEIIERDRFSPQIRAQIGDVLAQLGDPRFDPDCFMLPDERDLGFVKIPAGPFIMGSDKKDKDADEDEAMEEQYRRVDLNYDYWINRYPVTVAQYVQFIQAEGYAQAGKKYWSAEGLNWLTARSKSSPEYWDDQQHYLNRPVMGVTWFEAQAYCAWLSEALRGKQSWYQENMVVRLPTEAEWEKAARGKKGRVYPWGENAWNEQQANANETVGRVTAVGLYPSGRTPVGLSDAAGNVWEWTQSLWQAYPYDFKGQGVPRLEKDELLVVRGGSCLNYPQNLRAAFRFRYSPVGYYADLGFRVVVSLASAR